MLLAEKLLSFLEDSEILLLRLQFLKSYGPKVKTVWNKLDEQILALPDRKGKGLVNIYLYATFMCVIILLTEIHCVAAVADIFNRFPVLFQKDETSIHMLRSDCVTSFENIGKISKVRGIC